MFEWFIKNLWLLYLLWFMCVGFLVYKCFIDFSPLTVVCLVVPLSLSSFVFSLRVVLDAYETDLEKDINNAPALNENEKKVHKEALANAANKKAKEITEDNKSSESYQDYLIETLKDSEHAIGYLAAHFKEGDKEGILLALRNVMQAYEEKES